MKKLLIVLIAVLTVFTLASCKQEPSHEHVYNEYGKCLTCGDYKGTAMSKVGDYNFSLTNVALKSGKNYFSIAVDEDVDLEELDFYKTYEPAPYTYPTNIKKVDLYDSIRLQTLNKVGNSYPAEPILGTDGERTVYLVVECDADDTIALMCFIS